MNVQSERYRSLHVSGDELCVAAAFLDMPCLYGVSDRWIKRGHGSLQRRVMEIALQMERKGLILPELGGTVLMEPELYHVLICMKNAERIVRIGYETANGQGRIYLYGKAGEVVFMEPDGRNGSYLGSLEALEQFNQVMEQAKTKWVTLLAFERRESFYEPLVDKAFGEADENLRRDCMKKVAQILWKDKEEADNA